MYVPLYVPINVQDILETQFLPLSERFEMNCMLKTNFCDRENLSTLREWHNQIFEVFNKYAGRSRELPSSINVKDFTGKLLLTHTNCC